MNRSVRPVVGLAFVLVTALVVALCLAIFAQAFKSSSPLTIVSSRAGLVMNPDAKVKYRGVVVGEVGSIAEKDGTAVLHLDMDPDKLKIIPSNTLVDIRSQTVFGAKFVDLIPPEDPSPQPMTPGTVLDSKNVTVEFNTLFEHLTSVLGKIQPERLNETLGAIRTALDGQGNDFGQALVDLNTVAGKLNEVTPDFQHDLTAAAQVTNIYATAAPDLLNTVENTTAISQTVVDEQQNLDKLLTGLIGLSDTGNRVLGNNGPVLESALHNAVPTLQLLNDYNPTITCLLTGLAAQKDKQQNAGSSVQFAVNFTTGANPYEYPQDLPKVAASGGNQCGLLPNVPPGTVSKFLVADVGSNPFAHPETAPILNVESLSQILFGRTDVNPR